MVINQLLQLNLGSKVQLIAYADDLAIHGGPIRHDILYKQMTTALKKIETKVMQLGLKISPDKFEALLYRSNDLDWNFKIAGEKIPWRASVKYLGIIIDKRLNVRKQFDYIRQKTDIGRQRKYFEEYLRRNYTINTEVRSSYLRNNVP